MKKYENHVSGDLAELAVIAHLMREGWEVYKAVSGHSRGDLVAVRGRRKRIIDVKLAGTRRDGRVYRNRRPNDAQRKMGVEFVYVTHDGRVLG